ncbi:MAG: helix-turn-helix transcriptional regulator [Roseiarcus sp.]|jgi:transcriptional regulator with XRE-family HTH domain
MQPYVEFGKSLTKHRLAAGIAHQSGLAALMRSTQQTVSRWESGQSRPRFGQIGALAKALNIDAAKLAIAAGYSPSPSVTSFDQPFPIDGLSPESFERFTLHFLSALYPGAKVHRAGGPGHTQDGLDVDVTFNDGKCFHFQCKRTQQFGAAKARAVVSAYTSKAAKKFILLTRVASPKAREAIRDYKSWDIWDKEDVALQIRHLSKHEQIRLVDIFFKGQRLALLGETEPNVWQTSETFFASFSGYGAFNHDWTLVGRTDDANKLLEALQTPSVNLTFLVGTAGRGKTRVLKHSIEEFQRRHSEVLVRFLAPSEEVNSKSLEDLGTGDKVLIVDDAHNYQDLKLLFQYVASPANKAKLVLSLRTYSFDFMKAQASNFTLFGDRVAEIQLQRLGLPDATALATEVLTKSSGPVHLAEGIAKSTRDCPLITVMGAWVVSKERKHFEFVKNEDKFRTLLMARFREVITGTLSPRDSESLRRLLRIVAIIQPFDIEDAATSTICEKVEDIPQAEARRLFRILLDAGVLFRRGGTYRLSPDLLADYIIESECIGSNGNSTGYAEQIFDEANDRLLENVVRNLGKLDWQRSNGDPSNSHLMDEIWRKLRSKQEGGDPHLRAVRAVAYYQPLRALRFAEDLTHKGEQQRELPAILEFVAYNLDCLPQACELLWELGKDDSRPTGQHPEHAIRILAELATVAPNKPFEYNEIVVDFALSLFDRLDSWSGAHTPLDILSGIVKTEDHSTTSNGTTISFSPYQVRPEFVRPLRDKVRTAVIGLLTSTNVNIAIRGAAFIQEMLRYPMGIFNSKVANDLDAEWTKEFVRTFAAIKSAIETHALDSLVLLELARSVSWHANYSERGTSKFARAIVACLPNDLEFRTLVAIADPFGRIFDRPIAINPNTDWTKQLRLLAEELLRAIPDGEALRAKIESHLVHIATAGAQAAPSTLYWELLQRSNSLASATVENALANTDSSTAQFAAAALATIIREDRDAGLRVSRRFLDSQDVSLACAVGSACRSFDFSKDDHENGHVALVRQLLSSDNTAIVRSAIGAVAQVGEGDKGAALDLILGIDASHFNELADDVFALFHDGKALSIDILSSEEVNTLLKKIEPMPALDGYWIQVFLAKASGSHGRQCAAFFRRRVDRAADSQDWSFRASNYGPYEDVRLQFRSSPDLGAILRETSQWLKSRTDYYFRHSASRLFEVMFRPFDQEIINHLDSWLDTADASDIELIGTLVQESDENLVFAQTGFVSRFLGRARQFGKKMHQQATSALYIAATTGMRAGSVGEPFPRDVRAKDEAQKQLDQLPRSAPDYELYRLIKEYSEREIAQSIMQAEQFEE